MYIKWFHTKYIDSLKKTYRTLTGWRRVRCAFNLSNTSCDIYYLTLWKTKDNQQGRVRDDNIRIMVDNIGVIITPLPTWTNMSACVQHFAVYRDVTQGAVFSVRRDVDTGHGQLTLVSTGLFLPCDPYSFLQTHKPIRTHMFWDDSSLPIVFVAISAAMSYIINYWWWIIAAWKFTFTSMYLDVSELSLWINKLKFLSNFTFLWNNANGIEFVLSSRSSNFDNILTASKFL